MHRIPYKLQVSFRQKATNCRALLWEIKYKEKAPYASSLPCTFNSQVTVKNSKLLKTSSQLKMCTFGSELTFEKYEPASGGRARGEEGVKKELLLL